MEAFWCPDGDIVVFCSGSLITAALRISSFCAFVADFSFSEGIKCFLDGAIDVAVVAHGLEGAYWICCSSSSGKGLVPHSSRSAFDCDIFTFVGFSECLWFLAGPSQKAKEFVSHGNSRSLSLQAPGSVTANIDDLLVQGSGEHGTVSSLPVGLGQASGRVDVPDGAMIEAAAAFAGTLRSRPGKLDALREEGKVQIFMKDYDGHTRVKVS